MKILFLLLALLGSLFLTTAQGMGMLKKPLNPKTFFDGQQLVIAEGIARNDLSALKATQDLDLLSREGKKELTLMWFAADNVRPNFEAIKILVQKGVDPPKQGLRPLGDMLYYSLKHTDLRYLTTLLDGGFPVNYQDDDDSPLIQIASDRGSLPHVKLLVERGADIHVRDRLGDNALNAALDSDKTGIAKYLIQLGADVHNINYNGVTVARSVELTLNRANPHTDFYREYEDIRDMLVERGVTFPHQHPSEVKEWMRSQGMYVIGDD